MACDATYAAVISFFFHILAMKITTKIKKAEDEGRMFYSFEYFPPKTAMVSL